MKLSTTRRAALLVPAVAAALALTACGDTVDGTAERIAGNATSTQTTDTTATTSATETSASPEAVALPRDFRVFGGSNPKVTVTVIEDPACPACAQFHEVYGDTLDGFDDGEFEGDVALDFRVISFLDRAFDDEYSSRAANALYCAWSLQPDADDTDDWQDFHSRIFEEQPNEGGSGHSDQKLIDLTDGDFPGIDTCITTKRFAATVTEHTEAQTNDPDFEGTPTVLINGKAQELQSPEKLRDAVRDAMG